MVTPPQPDRALSEGTPVTLSIDTPQTSTSSQDEMVLTVARETVFELLQKMKVNAEVVAYYGEPDDDRSRTPVCVDIKGQDLSILIGRKAETLRCPPIYFQVDYR